MHQRNWECPKARRTVRLRRWHSHHLGLRRLGLRSPRYSLPLIGCIGQNHEHHPHGHIHHANGDVAGQDPEKSCDAEEQSSNTVHFFSSQIHSEQGLQSVIGNKYICTVTYRLVSNHCVHKELSMYLGVILPYDTIYILSFIFFIVNNTVFYVVMYIDII